MSVGESSSEHKILGGEYFNESHICGFWNEGTKIIGKSLSLRQNKKILYRSHKGNHCVTVAGQRRKTVQSTINKQHSKGERAIGA